MASKTELRAKEILRLLHDGRSSVEQLTQHFATSSASIRRDLVRLEQKGLVYRTHGGAMLASQVDKPFRFNSFSKEDGGRFSKEKQRIAEAATALIGAGETIALTAGTTTLQLARNLRLLSDLRVVTNAVNISVELSAAEKVETCLTGGRIRLPGTFSLSGPMALESLSICVFDKVFLGVTGIDPIQGATTMHSDEAQVLRFMCQRSKHIVVIADSSKVGRTSHAVICAVNRIGTLVTDSGISKKDLRDFRDQGVCVVVAD